MCKTGLNFRALIKSAPRGFNQVQRVWNTRVSFLAQIADAIQKSLALFGCRGYPAFRRCSDSDVSSRREPRLLRFSDPVPDQDPARPSIPIPLHCAPARFLCSQPRFEPGAAHSSPSSPPTSIRHGRMNWSWRFKSRLELDYGASQPFDFALVHG